MSANDELANRQPADQKTNPEKIVDTESNLKRLGTYLPLLSVLIILLGIIKQILYYSNFNLPIKYFLGISELGIIVSDDLIIGALVLIIMYMFVPFTYYKWKRQDMRTAKKIIDKFEADGNFGTQNTPEFRVAVKNQFIKEREARWIKENSNDKKKQFIYKIIAVVILIASIILLLLRMHGGIYVLILSLQTNLLAFGGDYFRNLGRGDLSVRVLTHFFFFTIILLYLTTLDVNSVENGKYTGTIIITKDDKSDTSTATHYFIGKTEKYVFLFNKRDTTTTILPTDEIKKIVLKEK